MTTAQLVDTLEFESPIGMERSSGYSPVTDKAKSKMELYFNKDNTGYIEWEVDELDLYESIGLTFEFDVAGKRTLTDYDGVMTLPDQAMDLLEKNGVDVSEMRATLAD